MTEEELKVLDKIDDLPKDLNIEIRGLILVEVFFRKENEQLKEQQKEFIEWLENKMKETHYTIFEFQAYRLAFEKFKEIIGE